MHCRIISTVWCMEMVKSSHQAAQLWDDNSATVQLNESLILHLIECSRHVEAAGVYLLCKAGHENVKFLAACRL